MIRILFLCTGNSCRSQMAEGWTRALRGDRIEAFSAGIETHGLNPRAVQVMAEAGVDISGQRSKTVTDLPTPDLPGIADAVGKGGYVFRCGGGHHQYHHLRAMALLYGCQLVLQGLQFGRTKRAGFVNDTRA